MSTTADNFEDEEKSTELLKERFKSLTRSLAEPSPRIQTLAKVVVRDHTIKILTSRGVLQSELDELAAEAAREQVDLDLQQAIRTIEKEEDAELLVEHSPSVLRVDAFRALVSIRAMDAFAHLNRLDDLWTLRLKEPGRVSSEQADVLTQITGEMRNILAHAGGHAERLQGFIMQRQDDFEKAFQLTLQSAELGFERVDLEQVVQAEGGFTAFAIKQLDVIRDLSWSEAKSLEAKMAHIRQDGITEGDLGQRFKCALLVGLLAASIAAMVATGTIFFPPIVAAVASGAPVSTLASLFVAHHGTGFILEATHVALGVAHSVEKCFKHKP